MPNPNCMTEAEWADVALTMSVPQVNAIADFAGVPGATKPGQYSMDWVCCNTWQPTKKCRGWFDNQTNLLVDKNVILRTVP